MAWKVQETGGDCPDETPVAVVNTDTDEVESCHANTDDAEAAIVALQADESGDGEDDQPSDTGQASTLPKRFGTLMAIEDFHTGDGRYIRPDALSWRKLPLSMMYQRKTPETGGHAGATVGGRLDEMARSGVLVVGLGTFSDDLEGNEFAKLVDDQMMTGVSIDLGAMDYEMGDCLDAAEDGECWSFELVVTSGEIMGATATPFPAINGAYIWSVPDDATIEDIVAKAEKSAAVIAAGVQAATPAVVEAAERAVASAELAALRTTPRRHRTVTASGEGATRDGLPPLGWFENPELAELTALTIDDDGRVYGHVAEWGQCHTARQDVCITPEPSPTGYAYFHTGAVRCWCSECEDPEDIPTGSITIGTGHAPLVMGATDTIRHYDDTGTCVAHVAIGDDAFGVWCAGRIAPGATYEQIEALRGASPSGDWRRLGKGLELVAVLAVNVPGFPIPRTRGHSSKDGSQTALVAAGLVERIDPRDVRLAELESQVARLSRIVDPLKGLAIERLTAAVHAGP